MNKNTNSTYPSKWLSYASALFCLLSFGILLFYLSDLPDKVPIHFSTNGEADNYAGKQMLWLIPAIQAILVGFFFLIKKMNPDKVNYPVKINDGNRDIQFALMQYMMAWLGLIISFYFFLIFWQTLELAVGNLTTMNPVIIFIMIGSIIGMCFWYYVKARKHQ